MLSAVSVPLTLLGLPEQGTGHEYDLKRDYDAFFGRDRPLRYSQVYATLSRLGRGRSLRYRPAYATLSRLAQDGKAVPRPTERRAERTRVGACADREILVRDGTVTGVKP
jgi:hypothetical protein